MTAAGGTVGADWSDALLDGMRHAGDPAADGVVAALFADGDVDAVNRLFGQLLSGRVVLDGAPPELVTFLTSTATLPAWADAGKIAAAEQLAVEYGFLSAGVLYTSGLPTCYVSGSIAAVLCSTLRLERLDMMWRRLIETGQFVFNVSDRGGMGAGGLGVRSTQQVRLMHAAVRHLILTHDTGGFSEALSSSLARSLARIEWDHAHGYPVNQQDLAWTLLSFSYSVIAALDQLGARLSPAEKDAYIHLWRVVGHVLGVDERLLFADFREAEALYARLAPRVMADTAHGRQLTQALVEFVAPVVWPRLTRALIRYHVGDECAKRLGVHATGAGRIAQWLVVALLRAVVDTKRRLGREAPLLRRLGEALTRRLVAHIVGLSRAHGRPPFQLPTHLAAKLAATDQAS